MSITPSSGGDGYQYAQDGWYSATERIHAQHPEIIIIGLSESASEENQEAMKRAGAARMLSKEMAVKELYVAIREAVLQAPVFKGRP
jgi:DNA-binding NarL/FixJ family response regulator